MTVQPTNSVRAREPTSASPPVEADGHTRATGDLIRETVPLRRPGSLVGRGDSLTETVSVSPPRRFGAVVRIAFGLIWLVDAYFKWQPSFQNGLLDVLHDGAAGQPRWLTPWFSFNHAVIAAQPHLWAYGIAVVETGLALALIVGIARTVTYVGGALWSLLIWSTAEGFGHTAAGMIATDIGTAIIYAMVFLALLAADRCAGTGSFSLDSVIERRLPGWRRVSEVHE